jgi:hypothetical protein
MNSANIKEKQEKLDFLDKLFCFLGNKTGVSLDVKSSKIVAGLEAEKTRYLLQLYTVVATFDGSHVGATTFVENMAVPLPFPEDESKLDDNEEKALVNVHVDSKAIAEDYSSASVVDDNPFSLPRDTQTEVIDPVTNQPSPPSKRVPTADEEKVDEEPMIDHEDVEELPDFESWMGEVGESKEL